MSAHETNLWRLVRSALALAAMATALLFFLAAVKLIRPLWAHKKGETVK